MLVAILFAVLLFYEFLIYYLAIFQYCWPEVKLPAFVENKSSRTCANTDHILADSHLLGETRSHEIEGLWRNSQWRGTSRPSMVAVTPNHLYSGMLRGWSSFQGDEWCVKMLTGVEPSTSWEAQCSRWQPWQWLPLSEGDIWSKMTWEHFQLWKAVFL